MSAPTIIVVCGDPGGAAAVAPVIRELQQSGQFEVRALAYRQAETQWRSRGLAPELLDEKSDEAACLEILQKHRADLLLVGTSVNGVDLEKKFIAAARAAGIRSFAVLDFWSFYSRRFAGDSGALDFLPDRIAIMDEQARDEMLAEGFKAERLVITGSPVFSNLAQWIHKGPPRSRETLRQTLGIPPSDLLIVFVSQPIIEIMGPDAAQPDVFGYTEWSVLQSTVTALETLAEKHARPIHFQIRPHPRETVAKFENVKSEKIAITVSRDLPTWEIIGAADLVAGMDSILLIEAGYLGALAVSLQPGLGKPDALPTNRLGFTTPVYHERDVEPTLEQLLFDEAHQATLRERLQHFRPDPDATSRIIEQIETMLSGAPSTVALH